MQESTSYNPYKTPESTVTGSTTQDYKPEIFSTKGRIGRLRYLAYSMIYNLIIMLAVGIVGAIGGILSSSSPDSIANIVIPVIILLIYIPAIVLFFVVARRRLNDLNHSGWLSLLMLVPLLNAFFGLYLLFWPGNAETNDYGPRPKANTALEVIIGLIAPLIIIGILAAVAIPAYQDYVEKARQAQVPMP